MRKFHELAADDPVWTANQPLTVGAMSKAAADAKAALAEARDLDSRVDDLDELVDDAIKSAGEHAKAFNERFAKLDASMAELRKSIGTAESDRAKVAAVIRIVDARANGDSGLGDLLAEIEAAR
jgi:hypothetical protein